MTKELTKLSKHGCTLARYEAMRQAIKDCHEIDDLRDLEDQSVAFTDYYKRVKDEDSERRVKAIRMHALRRMGQILTGLWMVPLNS